LEESVSEYPQKDFYRLSEVCQYTDTQPYVLRFWESEFPQLKQGSSSSGRRMYSRSDIDLVERIKHLLYEEEFTLAEARKKLEQDTPGKGRAARGPKSAPKPKSATARAPSAARPSRPRREVAEQRIATALPPREIPPPAGGITAVDSVPRNRYEDAIEEVDHLRLRLKEVEKRARKAEEALAEAQAMIELQRERSRRALSQLEKLVERLEP
jgi:DNA-binding transcriptional MerR regulator